jgi:hypothetical protein
VGKLDLLRFQGLARPSSRAARDQTTTSVVRSLVSSRDPHARYGQGLVNIELQAADV